METSADVNTGKVESCLNIFKRKLAVLDAVYEHNGSTDTHVFSVPGVGDVYASYSSLYIGENYGLPVHGIKYHELLSLGKVVDDISLPTYSRHGFDGLCATQKGLYDGYYRIKIRNIFFGVRAPTSPERNAAVENRTAIQLENDPPLEENNDPDGIPNREQADEDLRRWALLSAPCNLCGNVLPYTSSLQVDHVIPNIERKFDLKMAFVSIIKLLRAAGRAEDVPKGPKGDYVRKLIDGGKYLKRTNFKNAGPKLSRVQNMADAKAFYETKKLTSSGNGPGTRVAEAAWRLSPVGLIILWYIITDVEKKGYDIQAVKSIGTLCNNSLLNFQLLCGECNRSKAAVWSSSNDIDVIMAANGIPISKIEEQTKAV